MSACFLTYLSPSCAPQSLPLDSQTMALFSYLLAAHTSVRPLPYRIAPSAGMLLPLCHIWAHSLYNRSLDSRTHLCITSIPARQVSVKMSHKLTSKPQSSLTAPHPWSGDCLLRPVMFARPLRLITSRIESRIYLCKRVLLPVFPDTSSEDGSSVLSPESIGFFRDHHLILRHRGKATGASLLKQSSCST